MAVTDLYEFVRGDTAFHVTPYDVDVSVRGRTFKATKGLTRSTVTLAPVITKSNLTITTDLENTAAKSFLAAVSDVPISVTIYRKNIVTSPRDFLFYRPTAVLFAIDVSDASGLTFGSTTRLAEVQKQVQFVLDQINIARKRSFSPIDVGMTLWSGGEVHISETKFFNIQDAGFVELRDFLASATSGGSTTYGAPFSYASRWFAMNNRSARHNIMFVVASGAGGTLATHFAATHPIIQKTGEFSEASRKFVDVYGFAVGFDILNNIDAVNNVANDVPLISENDPSRLSRLMLANLGDAWPVWTGVLVNTKATPKNIILQFEASYANIRQYSFQKIFQRLCPYVLYEPPCNADQSLVEETPTVTAVNDREVTVSALGFSGRTTVTAQPGAAPAPPVNVQIQRYYGYGHINFDGIIRVIDRIDVATRVLTLNRAIPGLEVGSVIKMYPACDRTLNTCRLIFNNTSNFGGFPLIQRELSPSRTIHNYTAADYI